MNKNEYSDYLDDLARQHRDRIVRALQSLEDRVAALAISAPTRQGELFDLAWAIDARTQLRADLEAEFLTEVQSIVEEYKQVAEENRVMLSQYGNFVRLQPQVISQLQTLTFYGFDDIATTFLNEMADGIYQNTLTGRSAADLVKELRQKINGVYIRSDEAEVQRLVEIANFGTEEQQEEAVRLLHTVYASDRVGRNMRRYASQMVQDSLMQFDAAVSMKTAKESGADKFEYFGGLVDDSRDWCIRHVGKVYTQDEINELWAENAWQGKADGDPMIVRGGYNCQHHWLPTFDD